MTKIYIQFLIARSDSVIKKYSNNFLFIPDKNAIKKKRRIKNLSLF